MSHHDTNTLSTSTEQRYVTQIVDALASKHLTLREMFESLQFSSRKNADRSIRSKEFFENVSKMYHIEVPYALRQTIFGIIDANSDGYIDFEGDFCKTIGMTQRTQRPSTRSASRSSESITAPIFDEDEKKILKLICSAIDSNQTTLLDIWNNKPQIDVGEFVANIRSMISDQISDKDARGLIHSMGLDVTNPDTTVKIEAFKKFLIPCFNVLQASGDLKCRPLTSEAVVRRPSTSHTASRRPSTSQAASRRPSSSHAVVRRPSSSQLSARPTSAYVQKRGSIVVNENTFNGHVLGTLTPVADDVYTFVLDISLNSTYMITIAAQKKPRLVIAIADIILFMKHCIAKRIQVKINFLVFGCVSGLVKWLPKAATLDGYMLPRAILYLHRLMKDAINKYKLPKFNALPVSQVSPSLLPAVQEILRTESSPQIYLICSFDEVGYQGGLFLTQAKPIVKVLRKHRMKKKSHGRKVIKRTELICCHFGTASDNDFHLASSIAEAINGQHLWIRQDGSMIHFDDTGSATKPKPLTTGKQFEGGKMEDTDRYWWMTYKDSPSASKVSKSFRILAKSLANLKLPMEKCFEALRRKDEQTISIASFMQIFREMIRYSSSKFRLSRIEEYKLWRCLDSKEIGEIEDVAFCGYMIGVFNHFRLACPSFENTRLELQAQDYTKGLQHGKGTSNPFDMLVHGLMRCNNEQQLQKSSVFADIALTQSEPNSDKKSEDQSESGSENEYDSEFGDESNSPKNKAAVSKSYDDDDDMDWLPAAPADESPANESSDHNLEYDNDELEDEAIPAESPKSNASEGDSTIANHFNLSERDVLLNAMPCMALHNLGCASPIKLEKTDIPQLDWLVYCQAYQPSRKTPVSGIEFDVSLHQESSFAFVSVGGMVQAATSFMTSLGKQPATSPTANTPFKSLGLCNDKTTDFQRAEDADVPSNMRSYATVHPCDMQSWLSTEHICNVSPSRPVCEESALFGDTSSPNLEWWKRKADGPGMLRSELLRSMLKLSPLLDCRLLSKSHGSGKEPIGIKSIVCVSPDSIEQGNYRMGIETANGDIVMLPRCDNRSGSQGMNIVCDTHVSNGLQVIPPKTALPIGNFYGAMRCLSFASVNNHFSFANLECERVELEMPKLMPFASRIESLSQTIVVGPSDDEETLPWDHSAFNEMSTVLGLKISCRNMKKLPLRVFEISARTYDGSDKVLKRLAMNNTRVVRFDKSDGESVYILEYDPQLLKSSEILKVAQNLSDILRESPAASFTSENFDLVFPMMKFDTHVIPVPGIERVHHSSKFEMGLHGISMESFATGDFDVGLSHKRAPGFGNSASRTESRTVLKAHRLEEDKLVFCRPLLVFATYDGVISNCALVGRDAWVPQSDKTKLESKSKISIAVHSKEGVAGSPHNASKAPRIKPSVSMPARDVCLLILKAICTSTGQDEITSLKIFYDLVVKANPSDTEFGITKIHLRKALLDNYNLDISARVLANMFYSRPPAPDVLNKKLFVQTFREMVPHMEVSKQAQKATSLKWVRESLYDIVDSFHDSHTNASALFPDGLSIAEFIRFLQDLDLGWTRTHFFQLLGYLGQDVKRVDKPDLLRFFCIVYENVLRDLHQVSQSVIPDDKRSIIESRLVHYSMQQRNLIVELFRIQVASQVKIDPEFLRKQHEVKRILSQYRKLEEQQNEAKQRHTSRSFQQVLHSRGLDLQMKIKALMEYLTDALDPPLSERVVDRASAAFTYASTPWVYANLFFVSEYDGVFKNVLDIAGFIHTGMLEREDIRQRHENILLRIGNKPWKSTSIGTPSLPEELEHDPSGPVTVHWSETFSGSTRSLVLPTLSDISNHPHPTKSSETEDSKLQSTERSCIRATIAEPSISGRESNSGSQYDEEDSMEAETARSAKPIDDAVSAYEESSETSRSASSSRGAQKNAPSYQLNNGEYDRHEETMNSLASESDENELTRLSHEFRTLGSSRAKSARKSIDSCRHEAIEEEPPQNANKEPNSKTPSRHSSITGDSPRTPNKIDDFEEPSVSNTLSHHTSTNVSQLPPQKSEDFEEDKVSVTNNTLPNDEDDIVATKIDFGSYSEEDDSSSDSSDSDDTSSNSEPEESLHMSSKLAEGVAGGNTNTVSAGESAIKVEDTPKQTEKQPLRVKTEIVHDMESESSSDSESSVTDSESESDGPFASVSHSLKDMGGDSVENIMEMFQNGMTSPTAASAPISYLKRESSVASNENQSGAFLFEESDVSDSD